MHIIAALGDGYHNMSQDGILVLEEGCKWMAYIKIMKQIKQFAYVVDIQWKYVVPTTRVQ